MLLNNGFSYRGCDYQWTQVLSRCTGLKVLYLFSGPSRPGDFSEACRHLGASATLVDVVHHHDHMDLLDEATFDHWVKRLNNREFQAVLMAMPCNTFTTLRTLDDNGPGQLRGISGKDIYGLPDLRPEDKEKVRCGTLLALRGSVIARVCDKLKIPWLAETPKHIDGKPSLILLPEWASIYNAEDIDKSTVYQCGLGAKWQKASELWGRCSLQGLPTSCTHNSQSWTVPWSGFSYNSPHPRLRGTQAAIPSVEWRPSMRRKSMPWGNYISNASLRLRPATHLS